MKGVNIEILQWLRKGYVVPLKTGELTRQERLAAQAYAETGDKGHAQRMAGYSHITTTHAVLSRPQVQAEVVRIQQQILLTEGLPLAVRAHLDLLSAKTPAGARVQAVKLMYDRVLGDKDGSSDKDPAQMTRAEMLEEYARLTREAADQAKLVEAEVETIEPTDKGVFA